MSNLINKRKEEIKQLVESETIIPFAEKGFDLCLETFRSAKSIYQELFGETMNEKSPEIICKIYQNLLSAETEVAVKHAMLTRKKTESSLDDNTLLKFIMSNNKSMS